MNAILLSMAVGAAAGLLDARLESSKGAPVTLAPLKGKPVLVFYEDRDSTGLNQALKDELFKRGKERGLLDAVHVVAVADLQGFNWFPARDFALSGVRDAEQKAGIPVYIDWAGSMRASPWRLKAQTSNVVLLDAHGEERQRWEGPLNAAQREALFAEVSALVAAR